LLVEAEDFIRRTRIDGRNGVEFRKKFIQAALAVFDLCLFFGLTRRASIVAGALSAFGFSSFGTIWQPNQFGLGGTDINGNDVMYDGNGSDNCFSPEGVTSRFPADGSTFAGCSGPNAFSQSVQDQMLAFTGVGALNGNIRQASNGYGTTTTKTSGGIGGALGSIAGGALSAFSGGMGSGLAGKVLDNIK